MPMLNNHVLKNKHRFSPQGGETQIISRFQVKNGQCVPIDKKTIIIRFAKDTGKELKYEMTFQNLQLCKDIDNFLKTHPQAASCFNKDLNKKMLSVFEKHIKTSGVPDEARLFATSTPDFDHSLESRLFSIRKDTLMAPGVSSEKRFAISPIIEGHKMLEYCSFV